MTSWLLYSVPLAMKASIPYAAFTTLSTWVGNFSELWNWTPKIPLHINAVQGLAINCIISPYIQPLEVQHLTLSWVKLHLPLLSPLLQLINVLLSFLTPFLTVCNSSNFGVICKLTNPTAFMSGIWSQHWSLLTCTGHRPSARISTFHYNPLSSMNKPIQIVQRIAQCYWRTEMYFITIIT